MKSDADWSETFRKEFYAWDLPSLRGIMGLYRRPVRKGHFSSSSSGPGIFSPGGAVVGASNQLVSVLLVTDWSAQATT